MTTTVKTRCEVVDQIVEWTDSTGQLTIHAGDLVVEGGRFEMVSEIHWDGTIDPDVLVGFDGHNVLRRKHPADVVAVRRYIETEE